MNIDELQKNVEEIKKMFLENELAYLSLTSKNEFAIRDRIAYLMHKKFIENNCHKISSREYRRIDLAVLNKDKIIDIIELKSMYTFDSIKNNKKIIEWVEKDFEKNKKYIQDGTNQYEIVIATHPKDIPNIKYNGIVKYCKDIKKYFNQENLVENMDKIINDNFKDYSSNNIRRVSIEAGEAFGINVDVYIWIMQKMN